MQTELIILIISTLALMISIGVFRVEDAQGGRILVAKRIRGWFDTMVTKGVKKMTQVDTYLGRGIARLMLHYVAHGVLQRLLDWVSSTEQKIEHLLKRNKQVAKEIKTGTKKTHLDALKEHKEETALTEQEKRKLKSHD